VRRNLLILRSKTFLSDRLLTCEYFSDWAGGDPLLQEAYAEVSQWTLKGGSNLFGLAM